MTKIEVAKQISEKTGLAPKDAMSAVEAFMAIVKQSMCEGKNIYLRGFGTFHIHKRARKPARNITAGTSVIVPARNIAKFKPAPNFKKKLAKAVPVEE